MTIKHTSIMTDMKRRLTAMPAKQRWKRILGVLAVLAVFLLAWLVYLGMSLPKLDTLENYNPELASKVYSADGVLIKEFFTERRFYIPISEIPEMMIKSVLATEDARFYDHWGIRPLRFVRAILFDIFTLSKQQGASTLTQQLARRLYLTPEKTMTRKIREWMTAIQIERTYTKPEILEMYLNHMSFAHGTYGVEAAAQYLFGKRAHDLTLPECALLTASLQRPAYWNPIRYPNRALKRRNTIVLYRMRDEGFITEAQYREAIASPLGVKPRTGSELEGIAPYFTEWLRQNLQKDYGWDLYKSGMNIYTTLDSRVQACAEEAVRTYLPKVQEVSNRNLRKKEILQKFLSPEQLQEDTVERWLTRKAFVDSVLNERAAVQVALVAIDPRNGHILAMIGGRDFSESKFNRAVQSRRQPGSAFKPIVYTAAVDNGYMPCYEKLNQPVVVDLPDGTRWTPHNFDESISGKTTLREALRRSLNLVTTRLVQEDVPPRQVVQYARNLGITTPLDAVDALALGSCGVIPMELISAFGVFANHGVLVQPFGILRVEDKYGNLQQKNSPQSKGVLREETAYIMADMLRTVAQAGTGAQAVSQYGFTRPAGGKTGTTNDFTDAWYITFTPQMVVGTWVGHDDPALTLGNKQTGTAAALPITVTTIKNALITLRLPEEWLSQPAGVVRLAICNETKLLASPACPEVVEELFDVRYQPTESCNIHVGGRGRDRDKRRVRY
ncbi:MAG TPA: PBP1A family penicillin-binding protein [bacterium]|nr:PBP1A family penicillin-binding protein [bacterium]HQI49497.1 PBP1A family penicillin-binding protein [bacterium]HQJ65034.1 PBP1A family penicillin-binding protein [bacterium]